ncbi:hypothetical protein BDW22DRAFT_125168 [Trametopsis cervina]|nr:hypothetical protein BDW22DRAFT_125168 [Trametopsis cervina]
MLSTMATVAFRNSNLCDFCHTKPKYSGHPFCGKTCAAQAATLCAHCYQKPKFANFEYCGKNCAAQAQAHTQKPATGPSVKAQVQNIPVAPLPQTVLSTTAKQVASQAKKPQRPSAAPGKQAPSRPLQPSQQPTIPLNQNTPLNQWVHVAAAQVPHIIASLNPPQPPAPVGNSKPNHTAPATINRVVNAAQHKAAPANQQPADVSDPATQGVTSPTVLDYPDSPAVCQLPGCEEYAHVDANGEASDYCSRAHREEAVDKGLVDPCIMCLVMPQSRADYFCGRVCREEALHKSSAAIIANSS